MIDDIRYLIVFAKIVESGSVSGGAAALGLSTATASAHLSRLEKNLNSALLYRNTRKLSLTQDGESVLETARSMLELYEKGVIEFKQRSVSTAGKLRISIPAVFLNSPFTHHLANFIKENPDIALSISYSDLREDIIADSIDVAFRIGELPDSALKARHLFVLPRKLVAAKGFLLRYPPVDHPAMLELMPWIGLTMRENVREFRHRNGERAIIKYTPGVYVDSVEAAYALARQQIGLAAPPRFLCEEDIRRGDMQELLPDWSLAPLKVYALWPGNISVSGAAYKLINYIYNAIEHQPL
ncbi:TPA: LysR family transcriptional regulator [Klebsiella quasipneumoniae subsp. quasipneumoniae]|uniref:LysR family transcriptional regulator n=1 Tax=Klebsiella quasipneumoniae TaxID=1463165 RepID=UPI002ABBB965|nr:LysR family transcriptional regulator [Klebsiella quasipneumoniae]MDZ0180617.1 LysR family transcriptional regulator [Klebsiella quasipneumoniae]HBQ2881092.1 LysR family transcriptional regulator [Klebsiella quasipneumoniae subsp. quasipneumoniae]HCB0453616.1 LysR family transcriptional regulator [Klebsiella quasipneumoniae subsp. quasipneumoniae]